MGWPGVYIFADTAFLLGTAELCSMPFFGKIWIWFLWSILNQLHYNSTPTKANQPICLYSNVATLPTGNITPRARRRRNSIVYVLLLGVIYLLLYFSILYSYRQLKRKCCNLPSFPCKLNTITINNSTGPRWSLLHFRIREGFKVGQSGCTVNSLCIHAS